MGLLRDCLEDSIANFWLALSQRLTVLCKVVIKGWPICSEAYVHFPLHYLNSQ